MLQKMEVVISLVAKLDILVVIVVKVSFNYVTAYFVFRLNTVLVVFNMTM